MISQAFCTPATPMGANLVAGGATFRVWAPRATAVYLSGVFGGVLQDTQTDDLLLSKDATGFWAGFLPGAQEGDSYHFFVVGTGSSGYKRDPYARELEDDPILRFPLCRALIRSVDAYPWHDQAFRTPAYSDMVVYQLHIGTYAPAGPGWTSTFLDVITKIEHLAALGVNVVQPLPVYEMEDSPSLGYPGLGYQGSDLFSPAFDYAVYDTTDLSAYLTTINRLLDAKGFPPMTLADIAPGYSQLKAMIDLLHVYGIAVVFDVVYNHAGGWDQTYTLPGNVVLHGDDQSLYFWDRSAGAGDNNQSLYFTDQGFVGGLSFALWNADVRAFLLDNARFHLEELHADGFRFDEISILLKMNLASGWEFCTDLTALIRSLKPSALQNAEYWPGEFGAPAPLLVTPTPDEGLGFDAVQHDALREAIRAAIGQAAQGANAPVGVTGIAQALFPAGFAHSWQAIPCVENHDIVKLGEKPRVPALADASNARSWYARSRTRVAMGLLLTAPGIPQLFMGQEFLEQKQWCPDPRSPDPRSPDHLIGWAGLAPGPDGRPADPAMADHLRFTQDIIHLRRNQPALRAEGLNAFFTSDADRVLAFHRWVEGEGHDVVVVANLQDTTWYGFQLGFPIAGTWIEIFNSDVYDGWVNPIVAGNSGGIDASGPGLHGLPASATITIPANGLLVFARPWH